jgi:peroxiredoxin (alkyl hydroperoxide reductase subunit C)
MENDDDIFFDEPYRGITINDEVPDFEVEALHEGKIKKLKLSDYRGKWVALVFYPGDFTFVCPTELEELSDHYEEFIDENAEVLSVSTDSKWVHKAWRDASPSVKKIVDPMVADPTGRLARAFGVYLHETGEALRGSFVIDPEGRVKTIEIHHNDIGRNSRELLRRIRAAKFVAEHGGKVCPASWEPGKDTLEQDLDLVGKL